MEREDYNELLYRLIKHFINCYDEYMAEIFELDKEQIAEAADEIIAVKETYVEMCFWLVLSMCKTVWPGRIGEQNAKHPANLNYLTKGPITEQDAEDLLALDNPLKILAMKWWFYCLGNKADFYEFYRADRKNTVQ